MIYSLASFETLRGESLIQQPEESEEYKDWLRKGALVVPSL